MKLTPLKRSGTLLKQHCSITLTTALVPKSAWNPIIRLFPLCIYTRSKRKRREWLTKLAAVGNGERVKSIYHDPPLCMCGKSFSTYIFQLLGGSFVDRKSSARLPATPTLFKNMNLSQNLSEIMSCDELAIFFPNHADIHIGRNSI